jgi:hypothetical protein
MKLKFLYYFPLLITFTFISACNSASVKNNDLSVNNTDKKNILYIYQDGRMKFRSRYLNKEDVIIYEDGRGGEKAAIKMRVPRYPEHYRDSIVVVRVDNEMENAVSQN